MRPNLSPSPASRASCDKEAVSSCLEGVRVGGSACVANVAGDDAVAIRLLEMGLTPGAHVRVVGRAPFGDPIELEIRNYRLSIRRAEAARVSIASA